MALYTALPVYKVAYDLLIELFRRTGKFPREYKYTLGEKLKNEALELILNIYRANKSRNRDRLECIAEARDNAEAIRLLLRLSKDLNVIGNKPFVQLNSGIENVSVQLVGWEKYMTGVAG
ncbi:four helix bundle protein [Candidatus Electrothrix sp.]|uniref:four helix bundle protein n=1 Tax=Candidatus Electrothrix sp. TaxID=2170559 RepID=UPI004055D6C6